MITIFRLSITNVDKLRKTSLSISNNKDEMQGSYLGPSFSDSEIEKETTTAIIGSNGIGKTTLLRTILGEIPPLNGTAYLGHNVEVGYFRQGSDDIPGDLTVMEALLQIKNLAIGEARSFLARFLFKGEEIFEQVKSLSGGER